MSLGFAAILEQTIALLQSQGRISYGALKRRFQLDDAYLEDLKVELIEAQQLARDENGRILVWAAETDARPLIQDDHAIQALLSHIGRQSSEAERRQLTVLFCDLVGSTQLSGQLDPEDLRAVVRTYQEAAATVIARYSGYIAQYLGDGLLVYFGYPAAHEDDARRAVHTGLEIIEAIEAVNLQLDAAYGVRLAVRLGIHTGPVVVGVMGGGERHEYLAIGETPNIAARLQGLAAANAVVVSAVTARLVRRFFRLEDLGRYSLHGVAEPMAVSRICGPMAISGHDEEWVTAAVPVLVGREEESGLLRRRWEQSCAGMGQVVLVSGEAGIGKSALVRGLQAQVRAAGMPCITLRCSPYHTNSALYPIITHIEHLLQFAPDDTPATRLAKLEEGLQPSGLPLAEVMPLLAGLLSVPLPSERYTPLTLTPQQQKQRTLDVLTTWLVAEAERQPVLVVCEDLHWADPTTLETLGLVFEQTPTVRMLHVLLARPEFSLPWPLRSYLTLLMLNRLEPLQVEALIARRAGSKSLPAEVIQYIVAKTDGVSLYVEELTMMLLASPLLREEAGQYVLAGPLHTVAIPDTLQAALMARLDQLQIAKGVAQLGAVLGREFSYELLQAIVTQEEDTLQERLAQLVEAEILYQRGHPPHARYIFKHALIQDAAYASLLKSTRQQVHRQVAQVLESRFPGLVETQPELVAQHYTEAGCTEQAVDYWQRAGKQASERSANLEAISHVTTGIELLKTLSETPERIQHALTLYIALGAALQRAKGPAEPGVEYAYMQARALCQQVGETAELIPVMFGLWRFYVVRPQLHTARELGETLLRLARHADDATFTVIAHYALGFTWFCLGVFPTARRHLEEGILHSPPEQRHTLTSHIGQDPGVGCRIYTARTLWLLGYPAQALARVHDALALADELAHPFSLVFVRCWAAMVSQFCRDVPAVYAQAEAAIALATEQGFPFYAALGTSLRGWALAMQERMAEGMTQIQQGISAQRATGAALFLPYFYTMQAEVSAHMGHLENGLQALTEAHTLMEQHDERWWEAEIHRLRGVLLLQQPGTPQEEAETWLQRALDVSRRQQAKALELRASTSLARLWQRQGKRAAAYELLAPIYDWFTEGFDTTDLQEAKGLLDIVREESIGAQ